MILRLRETNNSIPYHHYLKGTFQPWSFSWQWRWPYSHNSRKTHHSLETWDPQKYLDILKWKSQVDKVLHFREGQMKLLLKHCQGDFWTWKLGYQVLYSISFDRYVESCPNLWLSKCCQDLKCYQCSWIDLNRVKLGWQVRFIITTVDAIIPFSFPIQAEYSPPKSLQIHISSSSLH